MSNYIVAGVGYRTIQPSERIVHLLYNNTPVAVAITELDGSFVTFTSLLNPHYTKLYSVEALHYRGTTIEHRLVLWFASQHDIEEVA